MISRILWNRNQIFYVRWCTEFLRKVCFLFASSSLVVFGFLPSVESFPILFVFCALLVPFAYVFFLWVFLLHVFFGSLLFENSFRKLHVPFLLVLWFSIHILLVLESRCLRTTLWIYRRMTIWIESLQFFYCILSNCFDWNPKNDNRKYRGWDWIQFRWNPCRLLLPLVCTFLLSDW